MQPNEKKELLDTAMKHNRGLLREVMGTRQLSAPPAPPEQGTGLPSALPNVQARKALLDKQYQEAMKKLQQKYAGKISPARMQALHMAAVSNIQPGAGLSPSSASVLKRALTSAVPMPTSAVDLGANPTQI